MSSNPVVPKFSTGHPMLSRGIEQCLIASSVEGEDVTELSVSDLPVSHPVRQGLDFINDCTKRHVSGDWGVCDDEDKASNDWAVDNGARIISVYTVPEALSEVFDSTKCMIPGAASGRNDIWYITEADRSATTILFPGEY